MFKGTPTTAPEEYSRIIAKNGGRSNAFTTTDMTVYFATMSRDKICDQLELEADRMANALLGETTLSRRKKLFKKTALRTDDNPASALGEVANAVAYTVHPYRRPVVGWMDDIQNLSRQDLVDFYKLYYAPNNAFIVVTGDFSTAEILPKIQDRLRQDSRAAPSRPHVNVTEPPQRGERRVTLKKEAELPLVMMYYHAPNHTNPDSFALDLLSVVLAGGRSSRLHHELVYKKRLRAANRR